jgi:hypothetical protein
MANKLPIDKDCHQLAYEILTATASWLENPDNELLSLLEEDDDSINIAATACVTAAHILKNATLQIQNVTGIPSEKKDVSRALEALQSIANELDSSDDPNLVKKAGLLDEILLTVAADVEEQARYRERINAKIKEIKARAEERAKLGTEPANKQQPQQQQPNVKQGKQYAPNEASLSTRYCPDHPGVQGYRKGDGVMQCPMDGKTYDFNEGFTTMTGSKIPGTKVNEQTSMDQFLTNPLGTSADSGPER